MSGKIKKCCLLHNEKTWTQSRVLQNLIFGSPQHQKEAQYIKPKTTLLHFHHSSVKFQRNRLSSVQDIKSFSVRPPPKFCLINLFMSSLSPAALSGLLIYLYFCACTVPIFDLGTFALRDDCSSFEGSF